MIAKKRRALVMVTIQETQPHADIRFLTGGPLLHVVSGSKQFSKLLTYFCIFGPLPLTGLCFECDYYYCGALPEHKL